MKRVNEELIAQLQIFQHNGGIFQQFKFEEYNLLEACLLRSTIVPQMLLIKKKKL